MKRFNKILFGFLLGFIFPVCISLLFIIIWFYTDKQEARAPVYALFGFTIGLLVDLLFLKHWLTGIIALTDQSIRENLQIMFGLDFEISKMRIIFLTFYGGFGLVTFQYFITKVATTKTIKITNLRQ